jgi:hypothetical protein
MNSLDAIRRIRKARVALAFAVLACAVSALPSSALAGTANGGLISYFDAYQQGGRMSSNFDMTTGTCIASCSVELLGSGWDSPIVGFDGIIASGESASGTGIIHYLATTVNFTYTMSGYLACPVQNPVAFGEGGFCG